MSIEAVIYLVLGVAAICGVAWVLDWIAREKIGAPPVASIVIWIIAGLLVLLVLLYSLRSAGLLHVAGVG